MSLNAPNLSAGDALDVLRAGWQAQQTHGLLASWMLHGRPGIGKTEIVRQLGAEIGARLFDLRLTTIEPQDLRGLPYYNHDTRKTVWYRPEDLPDDPNQPAILFLDELTSASPYLQPTVYGLLQERRVGQHLLPPSVMILAAGNTVEDGAIAHEMGTALSDRLIHLHLRASAADWLENYAIPKGLHPAVTSFLRGRPDLLETTEESLRAGHLVACTPRAWERASDLMRAMPDRRTRAAALAGTLGTAVAAEFAVVADDIAANVQIDALLAASPKERAALFPASLHGLNAVVFGLIGAADDTRLAAVIDTLEQVRHLADLRKEPEFARLPLAELCTFGFEILLQKALKNGQQAVFAQSDAYRRYTADRQALGLE